MHQLPPGAVRRIMLASGIALICLVILMSATFGGRPTAMDQAKRQVAKERMLWDAATRR
ncbi:MAG: hypothetical protein IPL91_15085 [Hyphomicrobium sp.]|nr:hypothetical protein [Hyphomicrobium sp.]